METLAGTAPRELDLLMPMPVPPANSERMYAIAFALDTDALEQAYPGASYKSAYGEIRRILYDEGFAWKQGRVYFGDAEKIDAVKCVLASRRLARELPWFADAVRDIRMLRIEENNDLLPAVEAL